MAREIEPRLASSQLSRIDEKDIALLEALQGNARVRLADLGRKVALAPSSVHERLRRLDRDGVIRSWTVDLAPDAFGLETLALVGVRASLPCTDLIEVLTPMHEIEECHSVAGDLSMILKVRVPSPRDLLVFVEALQRVPGVEGTVTTVTLKTHFERGLRPSNPR
jgi:Lrp/AsnC family leucine-responsive transcriptional regulator